MAFARPGLFRYSWSLAYGSVSDGTGYSGPDLEGSGVTRMDGWLDGCGKGRSCFATFALLFKL